MRVLAIILLTLTFAVPGLAQTASRSEALASFDRVMVRENSEVDRPLMDRLTADFPDHMNALREEYVTLYLEQGEYAANMNALPSVGAMVMQLFPYYIRRASDDSIIAMNTVTLDFSRSILDADPMRCTYNFTGQLMPNGRPAFDPGYAGAAPFAPRMEDAINGVIVNASQAELQTDARAAEATLNSLIMGIAEELTPAQVELIGGVRPVLTRTDHHDFCAANILVLDALLSQPPADAANAFRYQMSFAAQP